jgi:hypothetical protein
MAVIECKGYVNKPSTFGPDGKHARFTLAERQLQGKEKTPVKVYYDVTLWNQSPPAESSFATIKGYLNVEKVEKEGKTYTNLRINAQSVDIAEGRTNDGGNKEPAPAKAEDFDDLNF